ncbi:MAG TPA: PAS domain S-box protein, partial [Methanobacterium sp.]|nr:PAS domain S-box protein [Methanobacterium sp.]
KKYRQLVENAHEGIWAINLDAVTTFVNPRMAEMLGYSTEEIVDKSIFSFIDKKYTENTKNYLKDPVKILKGQYDFEFIRKDGENIHTSIETSPILNDDGVNIGLLAMVSDITGRKKAEEKVKESNIYHRGLIEASLDPLVTIGPDGKITDVNSTTEAITGHSRKELIGTDFSEYFTDPQKAREGYKRVFKEGVVRDYELEIKNKNGDVTPVSYNASIYKDENREVIGVFAAARDITEVKNAEESIKTSLKEKEILLREIHHRVKNNLQIISSLLSLQSNYIDDDESFEVFTESQNRVKSMAMIHEKLYKSESIAKIDFGDYVNDLTENLIFNYKISPNMIKLNKKFDDVFFDINTAIPCGLIINELVTNCLKHAFPWFKSSKSLKESSENLEFGKYKIDIELKQEGNDYSLTVADNGVGFPTEINFRETDSLGLQLVNNLVEQLDGTVNLESSNGTTFRIKFTEMNYEERI